MDIVYMVTTLHNFIVMYLPQKKEDIYDRKNLNNKESKNVINRNLNKDKSNTLSSDSLFKNIIL